MGLHGSLYKQSVRKETSPLPRDRWKGEVLLTGEYPSLAFSLTPRLKNWFLARSLFSQVGHFRYFRNIWIQVQIAIKITIEISENLIELMLYSF